MAFKCSDLTVLFQLFSVVAFFLFTLQYRLFAIKLSVSTHFQDSLKF